MASNGFGGTQIGGGGGGGGGYMRDNNANDGNVESHTAMVETIDNQELGLLPVTIKQILRSPQPRKDKGFEIDGREVTLVTMVGRIVRITTEATHTTYRMEDSTGFIDVAVWSSDGSDNVNDSNEYHENNYYRVIGKVRVSQNERVINAYRILAIKDFNEITYHFLEALNQHMINQIKQQNLSGVMDRYNESKREKYGSFNNQQTQTQQSMNFFDNSNNYNNNNGNLSVFGNNNGTNNSNNNYYNNNNNNNYNNNNNNGNYSNQNWNNYSGYNNNNNNNNGNNNGYNGNMVNLANNRNNGGRNGPMNRFVESGNGAMMSGQPSQQQARNNSNTNNNNSNTQRGSQMQSQRQMQSSQMGMASQFNNVNSPNRNTRSNNNNNGSSQMQNLTPARSMNANMNSNMKDSGIENEIKVYIGRNQENVEKTEGVKLDDIVHYLAPNYNDDAVFAAIQKLNSEGAIFCPGEDNTYRLTD